MPFHVLRKPTSETT